MFEPEFATQQLPEPDRQVLPKDLDELYGEICRMMTMRASGFAEPPCMFGRFELCSAKLGGMGMVLAAFDPRLDRKVAVKLWMDSGLANAALLTEAQTLAKLSHPNVVTIYETGSRQGRVYFVMQWVQGKDGQDWMYERLHEQAAWIELHPGVPVPERASWRAVVRAFVDAGDGLAAAHDQEIQHRDFKPANLLVNEDG